MRFSFTMNMPSRSGNAVHQVLGGVPVDSLEALLDKMANTDFLLVEEFYVQRSGSGQSYLESVGHIALNPLFIGKVKVLEDQWGQA